MATQLDCILRLSHELSLPKSSPKVAVKSEEPLGDSPDGRQDSPPPLPPRGPAPQDLRREEHRLRTLCAWPAKFLSAERAARNGLYYNGVGDTLVCHFCKVELSQWAEGDDVEADHGRWSAQCPFLLRKAVGNVPLGHDECGSLALAARPAHPSYMVEAARLDSFAGWPLRMRQTPAQLADAGFYYTGQGDQTLCYQCGGGLKDWEDEDDPWEQHALWFNRCPYLRAIKGQAFIDKVNNAGESSPSVSDTPAPTVSAPAAPALPAQQDASKPDTDKLCKICYSNDYNVCFVPCGHVVACMKCAMSVTSCPMCRQPYSSLVKLFYS